MPSTNTTPELSRPILLASIGPNTRIIDVAATPSECERVAARLLINAVASLEARFTLCRVAGEIIEAEGKLRALVTQECVVSLDPFASVIEEPFAVRFVPEDLLTDEALDPDAIDEIGYEGGQIDLGEAAVEQLALALDPFPRKPGGVLPPGLSRGDAPPDHDAVVHPFETLRDRRGT